MQRLLNASLFVLPACTTTNSLALGQGSEGEEDTCQGRLWTGRTHRRGINSLHESDDDRLK